MAGILYLVGTPIGNLGDISVRCAETLAQVDFIAAEDTRVTQKLLNYLEIKKPMVSYYAHNRIASGQAILSRLLEGESCALVADAGMPAISDPGEELVALCARQGITVVGVPGPCAAVTALALSGLDSGRFTFEGFLSTTKKRRFAHLQELQKETRTMIFYEAPHKLPATLRDMYATWGDRRIALCREMTKRYEEVIRTTLSAAAGRYAEEKPKGEFVLVIAGIPPSELPQYTEEEALTRIAADIAEGATLKDAVQRCAMETGLSKNRLYSLAIAASDTEKTAGG